MPNSDLQARIAAYFAALEAPLQDVPASRRGEFVEEARAHVGAMVEARRADGMDEARAWQSALQEFGAPEQIGRALHRQWASSGQLESEGAPLSRGEMARKFVAPVLASIGLCLALLTLVSPEMWHHSWAAPLYTIVLLSCIGFGMRSWRRGGGKWVPSNLLSFVFISLIVLNILAALPWGDAWNSQAIRGFNPPAMLPIVVAELVLSSWLRKRERAERPWRFSARFKTNPIAAEQEYRIYPLVGLAMGTVMGCIGIFWVGAHNFGLPSSLLLCALSVGGAVIYGWWLRK